MRPTPHETRQITAYLSVYNVTREFGGHEEGGWWYDSYEWLKVSIPFRAVQDYELREVDEDEMDPLFKAASSAQYEWRPCGPPRPADFQSEIQVAAHHSNLHTFFGDETNGRSSVLSHGDISIIVERNPGERGEWPRTRYE